MFNHEETMDGGAMKGNISLRKGRGLMILFTTAMLLTVSYGVLVMDQKSAEGATSIGSITVTGGNTRSYTDVNYLLDGNILVSGSGSMLTFDGSMISLSGVRYSRVSR